MGRSHEVQILLPNSETVVVKVNAQWDKIKDLKKLIEEKLGLIYGSQFEIFEIKNNARRLLHEDESVAKIYEEQKSVLGSLNPFKNSIVYLYTRHYYLSSEEEYALYKEDFVRT